MNENEDEDWDFELREDTFFYNLANSACLMIDAFTKSEEFKGIVSFEVLLGIAKHFVESITNEKLIETLNDYPEFLNEPLEITEQDIGFVYAGDVIAYALYTKLVDVLVFFTEEKDIKIESMEENEPGIGDFNPQLN